MESWLLPGQAYKIPPRPSAHLHLNSWTLPEALKWAASFLEALMSLALCFWLMQVLGVLAHKKSAGNRMAPERLCESWNISDPLEDRKGSSSSQPLSICLLTSSSFHFFRVQISLSLVISCVALGQVASLSLNFLIHKNEVYNST